MLACGVVWREKWWMTATAAVAPTAPVPMTAAVAITAALVVTEAPIVATCVEEAPALAPA